MKLFTTTSLVACVPARDFAVSLAWYARIFGASDEVPMDGMAEWRIATDAWLQLDGSADTHDSTAVIIGVDDVASARSTLIGAGCDAKDIVDYGMVKVCDVSDPDGHRLSFVQVN